MIERKTCCFWVVGLILLVSGSSLIRETRAMEGDGSALSKALTPRIDALFSTWDREDSPGCALGIVRDGELVYSRGYGSANLEHQVPLTPKTRFYLASTSKQFTAAAVLHAAREGHLSLDVDIRSYLPGLPAYERPITCRQLLHHRSGMRDFLELMLLAGMPLDSVWRRDQILDLIGSQRALNFPPGEDFLYSNTGYFLLGEILFAVTGKTLREYAGEEIFGPLGMKSTSFVDRRSTLLPGRADGHLRDDRGRPVRSVSCFELVGSGGVYSTVEDLARWSENFESGKWGGGGVLDSLEKLPVRSASQTRHPQFSDYASGLLLGSYRGYRVVHHPGGSFGFGAQLLRFPDLRTSIIVLANWTHPDPHGLASQVANLVFEKEFLRRERALLEEASPEDLEDGSETSEPKKRDVIAVSRGLLRRRAGFYAEVGGGDLWFLTPTESGLRLVSLGFTLGLVPVSTSRFVNGDGKVPVEVEFMGEVEGRERIRVLRDGVKVVLADAVAPWRPQAEDLEVYRGDYRSEELGGAVRSFSVEQGRLVLIQHEVHFFIPPLDPVARDVFVSSRGLQVEFQRDDSNRVLGCILSTGRARGVEFKRE